MPFSRRRQPEDTALTAFPRRAKFLHKDYERTAALPVVYVAKGGDRSATTGRACICNALLATAGLPQTRAGKIEEPPIVTMGDDLAGVGRFLRPGAIGYTAADVIATLTAG